MEADHSAATSPQYLPANPAPLGRVQGFHCRFPGITDGWKEMISMATIFYRFFLLFFESASCDRFSEALRVGVLDQAV